MKLIGGDCLFVLQDDAPTHGGRTVSTVDRLQDSVQTMEFGVGNVRGQR